METEPGKQMNNIDDLGRKPDGTTLDQPTNGTKSETRKRSAQSGPYGALISAMLTVAASGANLAMPDSAQLPTPISIQGARELERFDRDMSRFGTLLERDCRRHTVV